MYLHQHSHSNSQIMHLTSVMFIHLTSAQSQITYLTSVKFIQPTSAQPQITYLTSVMFIHLTSAQSRITYFRSVIFIQPTSAQSEIMYFTCHSHTSDISTVTDHVPHICHHHIPHICHLLVSSDPWPAAPVCIEPSSPAAERGAHAAPSPNTKSASLPPRLCHAAQLQSSSDSQTPPPSNPHSTALRQGPNPHCSLPTSSSR